MELKVDAQLENSVFVCLWSAYRQLLARIESQMVGYCLIVQEQYVEPVLADSFEAIRSPVV